MNEQVVRKTFTYQLHQLQPTAEQEGTLACVVRRCRELYNAALHERRAAWQRCGVSLTAASQSAQLPAVKVKVVRPEYRDIHSHVVQAVLTRLDRAFQAFFRRGKAGQTPGSPRFQGSTRYNRVTSKQFGNGAALANGGLVLSKIGRLAVRWSRPLEGTPKTVPISREADGWYVCVSCAEVPIKPLPPSGQETGIDLGLESFATRADGSQIATPRIVRVAEMALRRAQRRVSRRKQGSHRRRKAVERLAKAHQTVRRARTDVHHTTALALVRATDTIYHAALQTANRVQTHHLAKSLADAGWSAFLGSRSFKAACAGRRVVAVPPAYTSQACSGCGVLLQQGLSVRWHACPECGTSLHRDHNAALTILRLGHSQLGQTCQALTQPVGADVA